MCRDSGAGGHQCGTTLSPCCSDGGCASEGLVCRFSRICLPCGDFAQAACESSTPCGAGLKGLGGFCVSIEGSAGSGKDDGDDNSDDDAGDAGLSAKSGAFTSTGKDGKLEGNRFSFEGRTIIPAGSKVKQTPEFKLRGWS